MIWTLAVAHAHLRAQLVADGATATIIGTTTNIIGDLVVTNGSFTTLTITGAGVVTNPRNGIIGPDALMILWL